MRFGSLSRETTRVHRYLPHFGDTGTITEAIAYEGLSKQCKRCFGFGYFAKQCPKTLKRDQAKPKTQEKRNDPPAAAAKPTRQETPIFTPATEKPAPEDEGENWIQVIKNKKDRAPDPHASQEAQSSLRSQSARNAAALQATS